VALGGTRTEADRAAAKAMYAAKAKAILAALRAERDIK